MAVSKKETESEPMRMVGLHGEPIVDISSIRPGGGGLEVKCKIMKTMSYVSYIHPEELGKAIKLLNWPTVWYLLKWGMGQIFGLFKKKKGGGKEK